MVVILVTRGKDHVLRLDRSDEAIAARVKRAVAMARIVMTRRPDEIR
jgi:hypothetical protein